MADGQLTMFGKTYNTVGSANDNLVLQTKGDIKIRWGNKFIDLIKNGKVNAEVDILKKVESADAIHTDGIYLVKNGEVDEIWAMIKGTLVNIIGEISDFYVSYKGEQEVTVDEQFMALSNIGLYCKTYEDLVNANIQNGVVYILDTCKFYTIKDGEIKEYTIDIIIPDPLKVGNITINGTAERIIGKERIQLNIEDSIISEISLDKLSFYKDLVTNSAIQSDNFTEQTGYKIYYDALAKESIGIFDKVIVRKSIIYEEEEEVTYVELVKLIANKELVKGKKYIITDFQDVRCVTYDDETFLKNNQTDTAYNAKNVYPIVVEAINSSTLKPEGYFLENPEWIIEYDVSYNHVVKYKDVPVTSTVTAPVYAYSKGRITKMTDEFGNKANFDFKHTTFTDNKVYTFNIANPRIKELDYLIPVASTENALKLQVEKNGTNIYADATQDVDTVATSVTIDGEQSYTFERVRNTKTINNIIYLAEPELVDIPDTDLKLIKTDNHIVFSNCSVNEISNNKIQKVEGMFKFNNRFFNNDINAFYSNGAQPYEISSDFINNTVTGTIFFKDGNDEVKLTADKIYSENTFNNVKNSEFKDGLLKNIFYDLENVTIEHQIERNTFKQLIKDLYIKSARMEDNIFEGEINTNANKQAYFIDGTLINNEFKGDIINTIFNQSCYIEDSLFNEIKYKESVNTTFSGNISKCQFGKIEGCTFESTSNLYNVICYNNDLYTHTDLSGVIVVGNINNSSFKRNITKAHFYHTISRIVCEGNLGSDSQQSLLGEVLQTTFNADVDYISAKDSTIEYSEFAYVIQLTINDSAIVKSCTFNDTINNAIISSVIDNCQFMKLSNGIEVKGSINNVNVQVDVTPTVADYVEHASDASILVPLNPFEISTSIPKMALYGKKNCTVETRQYQGSSVRVFVVKTAADQDNPPGVIVMFSGLAANIPDGWAICDGTNGTPDLRGRFIRMVESGENPGAKNNSDLETNGAGTRQAYLKKAIKHTHTFKTYNTNLIANLADFGIGHSSNSVSSNVDISNLYVQISDKTLVQTYYNDSDSSSNKVIDHIVTDSSSSTFLGSKQNNTDLTHSHTGSIGGTASVTVNFPSISMTGDIKVPINYTPEQATTENGFVEAVNVEPQAYALIFIMKL